MFFGEFEKLRKVNIKSMEHDRMMMIYKLKIIKLIDDEKIGTKMDSSIWEKEMLKVGIPLEVHDKLLSSGGLKVLQKNVQNEQVEQL